ncbi:MAG: DUF1684 domain-containing protein [Acidobacteriota bacterium]
MALRLVLLTVGALVLAVAHPLAEQYDAAALAKFRTDRERILKADDGWLTVAGLHFLNPGDNRLGSDPSNDIVLDYATIPPQLGVITLNGNSVAIKAAEGQTLLINGKPTRESALHGAFDQKPTDTLSFGPVSFFVHYSGPRLALRVRDQNSKIRREFRGLRWYAPNAALRAEGRFTPYPDARTVQIPNILGDLEPFTAVGTVTFTMGGAEHTMEAWRSGKRIWFVFRDRTSGRETYPSARFLYTDAPVNGRVVMDFNYAQNPPCAYNPFTTCPLPPPQNRLSIAIEAGEQRYDAASPTRTQEP